MRLPKFAPILLILLFAGALVSGCLDATPQMTAMQARDEVATAAGEWDPQSELVFIVGLEGRASNQYLREFLGGQLFAEMGFEGFEETDQEGKPHWERMESDSDPGNGKAELWLLHYTSPTRTDELVLLLDRDGNVLDRMNQTDAPSDGGSVANFTVDSDEAVATAMAASDELRETRESSNVFIGSALVFDPSQGGPVWTVTAIGGDLDGIRGGVVQLDAVSGEVLFTDGGSFQP